MCERLTDEEKGAARSLVAEGRGRVGPEPTERELWAYHLGEMSPREEDDFAERLAHYPEAAKWLARIADGEPVGGAAREVSAEEMEAAWERWLGKSGEAADRRNGERPD